MVILRWQLKKLVPEYCALLKSDNILKLITNSILIEIKLIFSTYLVDGQSP